MALNSVKKARSMGGVQAGILTYEILKQGGAWHVLRDKVFYGDFLSRGDAVRGACFGARTDEARGRRAQVLADEGKAPLPHYEPHFSG